MKLYVFCGDDDVFSRAENFGQTRAGNHLACKTPGVIPRQARLGHRSPTTLDIAFNAIRDILRQHHRVRKKKNFVLFEVVGGYIFGTNEVHRNVLFEEDSVETQKRVALCMPQLGK